MAVLPNTLILNMVKIICIKIDYILISYAHSKCIFKRTPISKLINMQLSSEAATQLSSEAAIYVC